jgi:hypothetical protein
MTYQSLVVSHVRISARLAILSHILLYYGSEEHD